MAFWGDVKAKFDEKQSKENSIVEAIVRKQIEKYDAERLAAKKVSDEKEAADRAKAEASALEAAVANLNKRMSLMKSGAEATSCSQTQGCLRSCGLYGSLALLSQSLADLRDVSGTDPKELLRFGSELVCGQTCIVNGGGEKYFERCSNLAGRVREIVTNQLKANFRSQPTYQPSAVYDSPASSSGSNEIHIKCCAYVNGNWLPESGSCGLMSDMERKYYACIRSHGGE